MPYSSASNNSKPHRDIWNPEFTLEENAKLRGTTRGAASFFASYHKLPYKSRPIGRPKGSKNKNA